MNKNIDAGKIYNVKEIAEILSIHPMTVKLMIKRGQLKAKRIGHGYQTLGSSLIELLNTP